MARTTISNVKEIFDTDLSDPALERWMNIASSAVDQIEDKGVDDTDTLQQIETLWTAHLAQSQDREESSIDVESGSVEWEDWINYGEAARSLDPTDSLTGERVPEANIHTLDSRGIDER